MILILIVDFLIIIPYNLSTLKFNGDQAMTDKAIIAANLQTTLSIMFPGTGVQAFTRNILGASIYVQYTNASNASQCANGLLLNDPMFMLFAINSNGSHLRPKPGFYVELLALHGNRFMGLGGILRFRKINAATEQEAADKLVAWFKKNQELILSCQTAK